MLVVDGVERGSLFVERRLERRSILACGNVCIGLAGTLVIALLGRPANAEPVAGCLPCACPTTPYVPPTILLVDRSSSMHQRWRVVEESLNKAFDTLAKANEPIAYATFPDTAPNVARGRKPGALVIAGATRPKIYGPPTNDGLCTPLVETMIAVLDDPALTSSDDLHILVLTDGLFTLQNIQNECVEATAPQIAEALSELQADPKACTSRASTNTARQTEVTCEVARLHAKIRAWRGSSRRRISAVLLTAEPEIYRKLFDDPKAPIVEKPEDLERELVRTMYIPAPARVPAWPPEGLFTVRSGQEHCLAARVSSSDIVTGARCGRAHRLQVETGTSSVVRVVRNDPAGRSPGVSRLTIDFGEPGPPIIALGFAIGHEPMRDIPLSDQLDRLTFTDVDALAPAPAGSARFVLQCRGDDYSEPVWALVGIAGLPLTNAEP